MTTLSTTRGADTRHLAGLVRHRLEGVHGVRVLDTNAAVTDRGDLDAEMAAFVRVSAHSVLAAEFAEIALGEPPLDRVTFDSDWAESDGVLVLEIRLA